jgi:hypothetical protein
MWFLHIRVFLQWQGYKLTYLCKPPIYVIITLPDITLPSMGPVRLWVTLGSSIVLMGPLAVTSWAYNDKARLFICDHIIVIETSEVKCIFLITSDKQHIANFVYWSWQSNEWIVYILSVLHKRSLHIRLSFCQTVSSCSITSSWSM